MANLNETDDWFAGIYQLEEDDPVLGGPAGIDNLAPRQLASRALYQRLRNVTPWAANFTYPADLAFVSHAGTTWKSVASSTGVEPGTDETKWTRWAHTEAELDAKLGDAMTAHLAAENPHPQYATDADLAAHAGAADPHAQYALWNAVASVITTSGQAPNRATPDQLNAAVRRLGAGNVKSISAAGTTNLAAADAGLILVDATAGNVVVNLPAANAFGAGVSLRFTLVRADASANTVQVKMIGADLFQPGAINLAALATNPCQLRQGERLTLFSDAVGSWYGGYQGSNRYQAFPGGGSGNWTCPPFITRVSEEQWGGGGSGGACSVASGAGGGGGGGGYARVVTAVVPGTVYPYVVGQGGAAKTGTASGDTGGSTSMFGVTCTGGAGGTGSGGGGNSGGAGGTSSGASFGVAGTAGGSGYPIGSAWAGGVGGGTYGGASNTSPNVGAAGIGGAFPGAGGNGGAGANNSGPGGNGLIELEY